MSAAAATTVSVAQATLGRDLDVSDSLLVLIVLQTLFFGFVVLLAAQLGSPRLWSGRVVALVAALGMGASVVWWWVDKDVEGSVLITLSRTHGVTTGDLLSIPMLVVVGLVVLAAAWGEPTP